MRPLGIESNGNFSLYVKLSMYREAEATVETSEPLIGIGPDEYLIYRNLGIDTEIYVGTHSQSYNDIHSTGTKWQRDPKKISLSKFTLVDNPCQRAFLFCNREKVRFYVWLLYS